MTSITTDAAVATGGPRGSGRRKRQPGWFIPWLFVAFFGVVVAANGIMVYVAMTTYTGLETDNHYLKGLHYNAALEGARAQAERAWKVDLAFQSQAPRKGIVSVTLRDRYGNLLTGSVVKAAFIRPTSSNHDVALELPYLGDGRYGTDVEFPFSGNWDLRLTIDHSTGDYQNQQRVWVK